ncbi:MAG: HAD-IA family hydrolase [Neisseriales bacterium]|nr:MAG: HAD-IA family hydrolase [Neisseriales bacterium]
MPIQNRLPSFLQLIIFDWDGTLIDSTAHIVRTINAAFTEHNLPIPSQEAAKHIIGLSFYQAITQLTPTLPDTKRHQLIETYRQLYANGLEEVVLFDQVKTGLSALKNKGVLLAIATGKSRKGLDDNLAMTGTQNLFATTRTVDECPSKPDPAMIHAILSELNITPNHAIMIGDTSYDLMMARYAGINSVGVNYGAHSVDMLRTCLPVAIFDEFVSLYEWLIQQLGSQHARMA